MKVSDFRNDLSNQLDKALEGEDVLIKRGGVTFQVSVVSKKRTYADVPKIPVLPGQVTIDEAIDNMEHKVEISIPPSTPPKMAAQIKEIAAKHDVKFCKHNNVKGFCKKGCK